MECEGYLYCKLPPCGVLSMADLGSNDSNRPPEGTFLRLVGGIGSSSPIPIVGAPLMPMLFKEGRRVDYA